MRKFNYKRLVVMLVVVLAMTCLMATTAFAAGTGDVAGAVESTWSTASTQIKSVVDNVVFPAIDLILAVFFFAKLGTAYFEYRKSGQFEWAAPAILFACLVFMSFPSHCRQASPQGLQDMEPPSVRQRLKSWIHLAALIR